MHQATDRQLPEARYTFVDGMVVFQVLALQVFAALLPVEPEEESPDIVLRAFSDHQAGGDSAARNRHLPRSWRDAPFQLARPILWLSAGLKPNAARQQNRK